MAENDAKRMVAEMLAQIFDAQTDQALIKTIIETEGLQIGTSALAESGAGTDRQALFAMLYIEELRKGEK